jgi:GNAT superfamily N-acetyltransferase
MADARTIHNGDPGTYFVNETEKPLYQFAVSGINTCAVCWQFDAKLARFWPLPIHHGCRCRQSVCKPGQRAERPFIDYQEAVQKLDRPQQAAVMGRAKFTLWQSGVIDWKDAVTPGRVRTLAEVVANKRLTIEQMVRAGVSPSIAKQAYDSVHTAEHRAIVAHRKDLLQKIAAAGVSHEAAVEHIGKALASRVSVAPGPTYTTKAGVILPGIHGGQLGNTAAIRAKHATELKAIAEKPNVVGVAKAALQKARAIKAAAVPSSTAKLVYADEGWQEVAKKAIGKPISAKQAINLAGAPDGAASITTGSDLIVVSVKSDRFEMTRTIQRGADGKPVLRAEAFHVAADHQGQGIGADAFGRMVQESRRLGISRITTYAARGPDENGYWTWARFGYDVEIPANIRTTLPASLSGAERISDLMMTPEGSDWWKTHGRSIDMSFDLTPGSRSMEIWEAYLRAKATQKPPG